MNYEINQIDLPEQPTLIMKTTTPVEKLPEFFARAYGGVMAYLSESGDAPAGMPFCAYFNLDMTALEVEAGFPVSGKIKGRDEILSSAIPAGKFVSTIFKGPYDAVQPAYDALTQWAKDHGYEPAGVTYEYYLNDPSEDPSILPETEIRILLK